MSRTTRFRIRCLGMPLLACVAVAAQAQQVAPAATAPATTATPAASAPARPAHRRSAFGEAMSNLTSALRDASHQQAQTAAQQAPAAAPEPGVAADANVDAATAPTERTALAADTTP